MSRTRALALTLLLVPAGAALAYSTVEATLMRTHMARWQPFFGMIMHEQNYTGEEGPRAWIPIWPLADEISDRLAVRFDFDRTAKIHEVHFTASDGVYPSVGTDVTCVTSNARLVELYLGVEGGFPDANPEVVASILVPGNPAPTPGEHEITVLVEPPVVVPTGRSLFVAIEMNGTWPDAVSCVTLGPGDILDENEYWSNASAPPYDWAGLESEYNIYGEPIVSVSGALAF